MSAYTVYTTTTTTTTTTTDMSDTLKSYLKEINDEDKKEMFGLISDTLILKDEDIVLEKLTEYEKYNLPVSLGDIVTLNGAKYFVTCIYTDNSVDLLNEKMNIKKNTGLYKTDVQVIGKLECSVVTV